MVKVDKLTTLLSDRAVLAGTAWFLVSYALLQYAGLSGPSPNGLMKVLHQWPVLAGVSVLMAASLAGLKMCFRNKAVPGRTMLRWLTLFYLGLLLAGAGIFISSFTRFEGRLVLTEGQGSAITRDSLDAASLYVRKFSRLPGADIAMLEVSPFIDEKGKQIKKLHARVLLRDSKAGGIDVRLGSIMPRLVNGFLYSVGDVGYSPHFRLFEANGNLAEDAYSVLNIFPPGLEDSFRLPLFPHTFYLSYYPDVSMAPDIKKLPEGKKGPLYKLRVARNLDVVANTYASPDELIEVDALLVSFGDVRRWAELRIVRDPGLLLMIPGLVLLVAGGFACGMRRMRDKGVKKAHD